MHAGKNNSWWTKGLGYQEKALIARHRKNSYGTETKNQLFFSKRVINGCGSLF
jgi:hypothetical protein